MKKDNWDIKLIVCIFICLWALFLRFQDFSQRIPSNDEIYQFQSSIGSFKPVWLRNYYGDFSCFPGDYLLTYPFIQMLTQREISPGDIQNSLPHNSPAYLLIVRVLHSHKWGLAIPHILATIFGFYFLYLLCQRYFKTIWSYIISFTLVCFNATLIEHAFELRSYAVLPTLALGSLYFTELLVSQYSQISKIKKFWISMFFVFVVVFHVFGLIVLGFSALYSFISSRATQREVEKKALRFFVIFFVLASFLWLWYAAVNLGLSKVQKIYFGTVPTFQFIPNPLVDCIGFLKGVVGNLLGNKNFYILLVGVVASFLIPHKDRLKQMGFFLLFIVCGISLVLFVVLKNQYWFLQRQFIWVMPLFAFFVGWCWDSLIMHFFPQLAKDT